MNHVLPIDQFLPQIESSLEDSPCVILEAEPGAGKSTRVPMALLNAHWLKDKKIIMLEPRRLAAKSIARFMAKQLGEKVGQTVGFSVKNDRCVSKNTKLEIITEGILIRRLQNDPELAGTGLIIFDEFHERSLHADLALSLSCYIQEVLREDLKLLIMSATMDTVLISSRLNQAEIIQCPGRTYPVDCEYEQRPVNRDLNNRIKIAVTKGLDKQDGDLLVFLPGVREINQLQELLSEQLPATNIRLCPLYGGLSPEAQDQALVPAEPGTRKIVLATNVAETSLTIEGIGCVIDCGLHRRADFSPRSGMTQLITEHISIASADQRKGRAGRLGPGLCYRLWTESQQQQMAAQQPEEILVADLADLALELSAWGITDIQELIWITEPPAPHLAQARDLLTQLDLISDTSQITNTGKEALKLGLHPRLAHMLLTAKSWNSGIVACDIAALLAERDIFKRESDRNSDITLRLMALQDYRSDRKSALARHPLNRGATEQALTNSKNWQRLLAIKSSELPTQELNRLCGRLLAQAYPDRIAQLRANSDSRYLLRNGKGAQLWMDDALSCRPWLVATQLDGKQRESQIYLAAEIEQQDIEQDFATQIRVTEEVYWASGKKQPTAAQETRLGALLLATKPIQGPSPELFERALLKGIVQSRLDILPWKPELKRWLDKVRWLSQYGDNWPNPTTGWLINNTEQWLTPYLAGLTAIKDIDLKSALLNILSWDQQQLLRKEAPKFYLAPTGKKYPIEYRADQGPTVSVILQELFGTSESPCLAWGKVPITFELLSPARRPIQVTSDLKGFWTSSYKDVCKDMKGQYPKHRWPDDPINEKPGRSIKRKPI